ncbi:MAG TPA: DUF3800 domain-containing protein [Candidatus Paceibacterota bacterium]|nr:DUF3800 domain-containing protein [Candidatus Paceibacterota bacterium]HMP19284.1 DUF3800 domain-containing protein [Candidatus Paceibacterota bacterium]HMP85130.1 DUF3800 domain-containing protein [Candidatus Paceibacterota bacterium]
MAYIFLDESGDLGFNFTKRKTSKFFIVTFLFTKNKNELEKMVKKTFKSFSKKDFNNHSGVLHSNKESPKTRNRILNLFREKGTCDIITIYLNKNRVYTKLKDEKHILYNYVTNILLDRVFTKKLIPLDKKIKIIASRRETNKFLNENFSSYIKNQTKNNHKFDIEIEIKSPALEKGLQVADFISWAIFRKYEHGDSSYYNLIKSKIVEENPLFE